MNNFLILNHIDSGGPSILQQSRPKKQEFTITKRTGGTLRSQEIVVLASNDSGEYSIVDGSAKESPQLEIIDIGETETQVDLDQLQNPQTIFICQDGNNEGQVCRKTHQSIFNLLLIYF